MKFVSGAGGLLKFHVVLYACVCAAMFATTSAHSAAQITNAESIDLSSLTSPARAGLQKSKSDHLAAQFDAFDRHFDLQLQVNSKWAASQSSSSSLALYRGQVADESGSWVRLSVQGADVHGLVWDGHELFAIEPATEVSSALITPAANSARTVIFRIADTLLDPGSASCSVGDAVSKNDYGA